MPAPDIGSAMAPLKAAFQVFAFILCVVAVVAAGGAGYVVWYRRTGSEIGE